MARTRAKCPPTGGSTDCEKEFRVNRNHNYIVFGVTFVTFQPSKYVSWVLHLPAVVVLKFFIMDNGEQYVMTTGE